jgi:hypothetical protein
MLTRDLRLREKAGVSLVQASTCRRTTTTSLTLGIDVIPRMTFVAT